VLPLQWFLASRTRLQTAAHSGELLLPGQRGRETLGSPPGELPTHPHGSTAVGRTPSPRPARREASPPTPTGRHAFGPTPSPPPHRDMLRGAPGRERGCSPGPRTSGRRMLGLRGSPPSHQATGEDAPPPRSWRRFETTDAGPSGAHPRRPDCPPLTARRSTGC
jgi:hypothetical protein